MISFTALIAALALTSAESPERARVVSHAGTISGHEVWTASAVHRLESTVRLLPGATLEIEPGTRIEAQAGSAIIISRQSRISAVGTAAQPIILTCVGAAPVQGCWLGVLIAGNAPVVGGTNTSPAARGIGASGCAELPGDGFHGAFGGCDPNDDAGEMRYVRIEYAARGLELLGVGRGTRIESVQVHNALVTAVRVRGGTADLRRVMSSSHGEVALAWSDGWQGRAQQLVLHRVAGEPGPVMSGEGAGPVGPTLIGVTIVGDLGGPALRLTGTGTMSLRNAIVVAASSVLDVDGSAACTAAASGQVTLSDVLLVGVSEPADPDADADCAAPTAEATVLAAASGLQIAPMSAVASVLKSALTDILPDLRTNVLAATVSLTGAMPPADGFFEQTDLLGGVESDVGFRDGLGIIPWYSGWAAEGTAARAPLGVVIGTTATTAGAVVNGVRVRVSGAYRSGISGLDGGYVVGLVPPGAVTVSAELLPAGCTAAPVNASVVAGAVTTVNVLLDCGPTTITTSGMILTYICGNRFRVRNPNLVAVPVTWSVFGTTEQGSLLLPPRAYGAPYSETFFMTTNTGTVKLFYLWARIDVKANGGFVCAP